MPEPSAESIRVLIVDDIAEFRENIRKLLQFEKDIEVVGAARTGQEGLEIARATRPHVVVMDINMPDMDGISVTRELLKDVEFAQIIIVSVQNEPHYMREAMRAGASDFIPKPPSTEELITSVRQNGLAAIEKEERQKSTRAFPSTGPLGQPVVTGGKMIAVYSPKGGVGCTTLATNLAIGLNAENTPAVLVDGHLQFGDVSVFLNMQVKLSMVDLASRAEELDREFVDEILMSHSSGLRVLPAPPRPEMADEIHADQVRPVLRWLKGVFAYVVVDTSSTMDDTTLAILDESDLILAVATPEIPAIKDARLFLDLAGILGMPRERVFFVLNKMDKRSGIAASAVAENLKKSVDAEIPFVDQVVTTSINKGVPLLLGDKSKIPAKNLLELVASVKERLLAEPAEEETEEPVAERPRLFAR
ncbi:MAG: response regulator [Anaerolineales bacterium]|nr:response regulator [Anaerolineales bacterium]